MDKTLLNVVGRIPAWRGAVDRIVIAKRDIHGGYSPSIYRGQACFVTSRRRAQFDGIHAIKLDGMETVAVVEWMLGGAIRLSWKDHKNKLMLMPEEMEERFEHIGPVVGCYSNDCGPPLWMFTN